LPDQAAPEDTTRHASAHRRPLITAAVIMGLFMAAVESTIVATAMPTIVADLGGFRLFSWVFAIYLLAQAIAAPIYGRLADVYGRKRVFCAGATLFLVGSTLCGFAPGMIALIGFRALQGLGAGAILPISTTIIADIYDPTERARIQGYLGSVWGVSAIIGPVLGAFIVQHLTWSIIFWVNLPIGVIAIAMIAAFLREDLKPRMHSIDYLGSALLVVGSGSLMLALIQANQLPPALLWTFLAVAAVGIAALIRHERVAPEPMLRLDLWKNRVIAIGNLGSASMGAVLMGITAFLPAYVQGAMGRSPVVAGFALAAMSIGWASLSGVAGRTMLRHSYRTAAILGGLGLIVGNILLVLLQPSFGPLWAAAGALLVGAGMGFCNTTFLVSVQSSVGWHERGTATSSLLFMRMLGQSIGVAIFGGVFNYALFAGKSESSDVVDRLMEPSLRQGLPETEIARLTAEVASALHEVYLIALAMAVLTLALGALLPAGHSPTVATKEAD
jgi:EmrB/QacA subfamily drug resistance transporter